MKLMDLQCPSCGHTVVDYLERAASPARPLPCPQCGKITLDRVLLGGMSAHVHGDECDVWVKHGICNADGSPRHYTSRQEMTRAARELGARTDTTIVNKVQHIGLRGTDKNPHTQRFVSGLPPGVDGRPMSMLTPEEQAIRHQEWLATEPA